MTGHEAIAILKRTGVTQAEFARRVGVTKNTISNWAGGQKPAASAVALLRLLDARPELIHVLGKEAA